MGHWLSRQLPSVLLRIQSQPLTTSTLGMLQSPGISQNTIGHLFNTSRFSMSPHSLQHRPSCGTHPGIWEASVQSFAILPFASQLDTGDPSTSCGGCPCRGVGVPGTLSMNDSWFSGSRACPCPWALEVCLFLVLQEFVQQT